MAAVAAATATKPPADDAAADAGAQAVGIAPVVAGTLAFGVAGFLMSVVDETELLFALTACATAAVWLLRHALHAWYRADDGRVDAFERVGLAVATFFLMLGLFTSIQYGVRLATDALTSYVLPPAPDFVLLLGVLLLIVFSALPTQIQKVVAIVPGDDANDADDGTAGRHRSKDA